MLYARRSLTNVSTYHTAVHHLVENRLNRNTKMMIIIDDDFFRFDKDDVHNNNIYSRSSTNN